MGRGVGRRGPMSQRTTAELAAGSQVGSAIVIQPTWVSTMPATSGTRKAPAGMRSRRATTGPTIASARVSARGNQATGGNQTMAAGPMAMLTPDILATSEATPATATTLTYLIEAHRP